MNSFMLMRFFPQLCMTFFICLFILMMQFLFRYINDLVGKGLDMATLGELFFYAACSMVPMALPLAILLASLMTFGNLGEHVELTALKSSGISLITVMKPLIIFVGLIAVGAFFFQNDVLPKTQVQMWTLLFSAREKSASLSITPGEINSEIPGFNVYVKRKDKVNDMLYDVIIYDVSSASNYPRIVTADSAKLNYTQDKKHILLKLYHGNWYEDLGQGGTSGSSFGSDMFRRETYHDKVILISYDATFTKMDDNAMRSQYIGKNIKELNHSIDSIRAKCDSVGDDIGKQLKLDPVCGVQSKRVVIKDNKPVLEAVPEVAVKHNVNLDSLFDALDNNWEGFKWINADDAARSIFSFIRRDGTGKNSLLFVVNFTPMERSDYMVGAPKKGRYTLIFDQDGAVTKESGKKTAYTAKAGECDGQPNRIEYKLAPYGCAVFKFNE